MMLPLTNLRKRSSVALVFALAWFVLVAGPCVMAEASISTGPEQVEIVHGDCITPPTIHSVEGASDCCDPTFALKTDVVKTPVAGDRTYANSFFADDGTGTSVAYHSADSALSGSGPPLYLETLRLRI